jgi:hypothetical protein
VGKPQRQPANYHKLRGVRQFHGCYSVGDDTLFGVVRHRKSAENTLAGLRSIRAARPDGERVYVILDNLSAHKGLKIRTWAERNRVELYFTPTYTSWANPIEAHFGPLREFELNNSNHPQPCRVDPSPPRLPAVAQRQYPRPPCPRSPRTRTETSPFRETTTMRTTNQESRMTTNRANASGHSTSLRLVIDGVSAIETAKPR